MESGPGATLIASPLMPPACSTAYAQALRGSQVRHRIVETHFFQLLPGSGHPHHFGST